MTHKEMEEFGNKEITITREQVANIIALRIAEEKKMMKEADLNPMAEMLLCDILTHICADIMHEMFAEEKMEVEE